MHHLVKDAILGVASAHHYVNVSTLVLELNVGVLEDPILICLVGEGAVDLAEVVL